MIHLANLSKSHRKQAIRHFRKNQLIWFPVYNKISHLTATPVFKESNSNTFFLWINTSIVAFQTIRHLTSVVSLGWCLDSKKMDTSLEEESSEGSQHPHPCRGSSLSAPWTTSGQPRGQRDQTPQGRCLLPATRAVTPPGRERARVLPPNGACLSEHNSVGCTKIRFASARPNREMRIICRCSSAEEDLEVWVDKLIMNR